MWTAMLAMALAAGEAAAAMTEGTVASPISDADKAQAMGDLQRALFVWRSGHFGGLAFYYLRSAPEGELREKFEQDGALTQRLPENWAINSFKCADSRRCTARVEIRFKEEEASPENWGFDLVLPPEGGFWQLLRAAKRD